MASHEFLPVLIAGCLVWGALVVLGRQWALPVELSGASLRARLLPTAFLLGLMVGLPVGGLTVDEWGAGWGLAGGSVLAAASVALLGVDQARRRRLASFSPRRPSLAAPFGGMVGLGAGAAWLACASTVLLPAGLGPAKPGAALNVGYTVVALGGLLAPFLLRPLQQSGRAFVFLAVLCLLPLFLAVLTPTDAWPHAQQVDLDRLLSDPVLWLAAGAMAFYGLLATRLDAWLAARGTTQPAAAWMFWGPFLLARLVVIPGLEGAGVAGFLEPWLAVALTVVAAVALGQMLGAPEADRPPRALYFVGLGLGPVAPTLLAVVMQRFSAEPALAVGLALLGGVVGEEAVEPLLRSLGKGPGENGWRLPLASTLGLATLVLTVGLLEIRDDTRLPKPPSQHRFPTWRLPRLPHFQMPSFRKPAPPTPTAPEPAASAHADPG